MDTSYNLTPLLLNQRQLQRVLSKERMRADRESNCFGLIILRVIDLKSVRPTTLKLAKLLHRRLRDTDEKGHLNYGRIGVVLPATDEDGTQLVLADILRQAAEHGLPIEGEAFVYPERPKRSGSNANNETSGRRSSPHSDTVEMLPEEVEERLWRQSRIHEWMLYRRRCWLQLIRLGNAHWMCWPRPWDCCSAHRSS